jgi:hypothetical protein
MLIERGYYIRSVRTLAVFLGRSLEDGLGSGDAGSKPSPNSLTQTGHILA